MHLRILVVDDSATDRLRMIRSLKRFFPKAQMVEASDGDQAIDLLGKHPFDLLLTDQHMGRVSGIAVLREARRQRPETLRIMMTADENLGLVQDALMEGVQGYILKKWPAQRIADEIQRMVMKPA